MATISVPTANVRATPATNGKIVTTLKLYTRVELIGRSADSQWFQINVAGQPQPGWISVQTFQISSGNPIPLPVGGIQPAATQSNPVR
ncbi:MAG: SH3 domain-containing protein [Chloroflexi bacterium]|nr:SH3 domain-containing protein [Chloroflexota bacterium]